MAVPSVTYDFYKSNTVDIFISYDLDMLDHPMFFNEYTVCISFTSFSL